MESFQRLDFKSLITVSDHLKTHIEVDLTLKMLITPAADDTLIFLIFFFRENKVLQRFA